MVLQIACEQILERLKPYQMKNPKGNWEDWVSKSMETCSSPSQAFNLFTILFRRQLAIVLLLDKSVIGSVSSYLSYN